jgi:hypothetical protein
MSCRDVRTATSATHAAWIFQGFTSGKPAPTIILTPAPALDSDEVFRLLQRVEDSSVSRQRRSDPSRHAARGPRHICARPRRASSRLLQNLIFGTDNGQHGFSRCVYRKPGLACGGYAVRRGAHGRECFRSAELGARPAHLVQRSVRSGRIIVGGVRIQRRCASPKTTIWSTHSRRIDPINLSAKPFCQGKPRAMGLSRMPSVRDNNAIDAIPITDQVARSLIPRECLCDLACNPFCSRIRCNALNPMIPPVARDAGNTAK